MTDKKIILQTGIVLGGVFSAYSLLPMIYNKWLNTQVMRRTGVPKTVMLTFDDGPDERYTGRILDLLKKENVKAVFFTVTSVARENEPLIDRMIAEGHTVGFHSIDHQNAMMRGVFHTRRDFREGYHYLKKKGVDQIYYRPPWGHTNLFTWHYVKKYRMRMVLWDVMAEDWEKKATVGSIRTKCLSRVRSQSVICLHDGGEKSGGAKGAPEKTLEALKYVIPALKRAGYRFILPGEAADRQ